MKRKAFGAALVTIVIVLGLVFLYRYISSPGSADTVSVRLPIPIIEAGQSPFYLAQDNGFYAAENLKVSFHLGSPEQNPVTMVASKADTFGVLGGPDTLLVARSRQLPLKAIAILHRNSNFPVLLTLADSGITKVSDLRGQKVGFFYGHISTDVIRNLFRKEGVPIQEVDVGFDYTRLVDKQLAAQWAFRVTAGLDLPARGVDINVINPADYGIRTHGYTIFAHEDTLREKPEMVERFLRATLRGVDHAVKYPQEANAAILARSPAVESTLNLERQKMYNAVTSASAKYPLGYMDRAMWQETYDRLSEEGVLESEFDLSEAYTLSFLRAIHGREIGD